LPVSEMGKSKNTPSILFVCCGNRERSVIAENLLRQRLKDTYPHLFNKVNIGSAGIFPRTYLEHASQRGIIFEYPYFGKSPNIYAIDYLAQRGIDISFYRSRQLSAKMVVEAGLILAVDQRIRDEILDIYPESSGKVFTFKEFAFGPDQPDLDIGDSMKLPEIDKEKGIWIWPEGYAAEYINEIEHCFTMGMEKFVRYINGTIKP
jgi:protein-tyrosine-phosphatase